jgi:hypothetical protein
MYLSYNNNEEVLEIPVLPSEFSISSNGNDKSYDILNLGEATLQKLPQNAEFSIDSEFPATVRNYETSANLLPPREYVLKIEKWRGLLKPLRFIYVGGAFEINTSVSITNFSYKEEAGGSGDILYTLDLKEYKFAYAKRYISDLQEPQQERPNMREIEQYYTTRSGDTPLIIAKRLWDDDSRRYDLFRLNGLEEGQFIPVGTTLRVV